MGIQSGFSQDSSPKISVNIPSIQQEATSIWRTINDIEFLEKLGYQIALPKHSTIDSLISKSRAGNFGNEDFPTIYQLLESGIYDIQDYQSAFRKVIEEETLLNEMIKEIYDSKDSWDWDFTFYKSYPVVFTLYGTGGSYDPNSGRVTLFTTTGGKFKQYSNPANTIIHEIVHLGMEKSIVQKHQLSHELKERIVDKFVYLMFLDRLPDYKIQNMGEQRIDDHLQKRADLEKLEYSLKILKE
ncbi:MAG: hypothetical protein MRZ79_27530 [Bacteroidia bacterium]|nr:hypothetical protein [Bacteroidia bacterium]